MVYKGKAGGEPRPLRQFQGASVLQIGNTCNDLSNGMEQIMTLSILIIGAYTVMNDTDFTIN
jgi:ABC-type bacteriocin/lantibiotic exporter with double-glycine peptidase domain